MPGAGKTIMAAATIHHLWGKAEPELDAVAYIYCDYKNRRNEKAKTLLSTVLRQLVQSREGMPEVLSNFDNDSQKRSRDLSFNEISDVLEPFLVSFRNTYLVIDALDERIDKDSTHLKLLQGIRKL
jgi:hypothetical protein